jgi:hypothetical protein
MGQIGQMAMNPTSTVSNLMGTVTDPQKMASGFVGPTAAGIKPPPAAGGAVKKPESVMGPHPSGELQQRFSIDAGGSGMMDAETERFLQMLAGGR